MAPRSPNKSTRRWIVAVIAAVLLVAGSATAWAVAHRDGPTATTATTSLVAAALTTEQQTVQASGTIQPATQSTLSFQVAGTVTSVAAVVGQKVSAGQVLATVNPTTLQANVTAAQANLTAANANLNALQSSTTSTATQISAAQAQVSAAQAKLTAAQQSLAGTNLTSPIDGVVASVG